MTGAAEQVALTDPLAHVNTTVLPTYEIDCTVYPDICQNWCYYVFCHKGGVDGSSPAWTVTVDRTVNRRLYNECGMYRPNKCSANPDRKGSPWPANPTAGQHCDEQPKASNAEGGAGAATRCMDAHQNTSEGATWGNFISGYANGQKVVVSLKNHGGAGVCASLHAKGTTVCPAAASPPSTADPVRQQ